MIYSNLYARLYTLFQRVREAVSAALKFYPTRLYLSALLMLQILAWVQAVLIRRRLSGDFMILHYNVDFGVDAIGSPAQVFLYPLIGLAVLLVNFIIVSALSRRKESKFIAHLFLGSATVVSAFLSLALLSIRFINFR